MGCGYGAALVRRVKRPVSPELLSFTRREQMGRLKRFFARGTQLVEFDGTSPGGRAIDNRMNNHV
jgi:hypothetical protein